MILNSINQLLIVCLETNNSWTIAFTRICIRFGFSGCKSISYNIMRASQLLSTFSLSLSLSWPVRFVLQTGSYKVFVFVKLDFFLHFNFIFWRSNAWNNLAIIAIILTESHSTHTSRCDIDCLMKLLMKIGINLKRKSVILLCVISFFLLNAACWLFYFISEIWKVPTNCFPLFLLSFSLSLFEIHEPFFISHRTSGW